MSVFQAPGETRQEDRREFDPTILEDGDQDFISECAGDSLDSALNGTVNPQIKITTSGDDEESVIPFGECLQSLIPNSVFETREGTSFTEFRNKTIEEGFSDLLVLVSANKMVYSMMQIHLPDGPCAHWRVTSINLPHQIPGHGVASSHYPEVIMKRFETHLGRTCSRMLKSLFPAQPQFEGRRACIFHHQRDFIFFRHYRYIFDTEGDVKVQECGPRFTLKLLWLQEGPFDPSNGQYTFYRRQRHESSRRRWWL